MTVAINRLKNRDKLTERRRILSLLAKFAPNNSSTFNLHDHDLSNE